MRGPHVSIVLAVVLATGLAACGTTTTGTEVPDAGPTTTASPVEPTPSPDGEATASPTPSAAPSAEPSPTPTELAGEPYDGPPLGGSPASLAVVGVTSDDVLNVRSGPGTDAAVVTTLDPLATEVAATGRARLLPGSIWLEVAVDGTLGWASSSYLAFLGRTDDITSQVLAEAGSPLRAETLADLARDVAALRASEEPPSRIAISGAPAVGDLGEVTVDVVGLGDDALLGERLVVFATPGDEQFTVRSVEATQLCARGPGTEVGCP